MNKLALFDADGTLYDGFSIYPLYDSYSGKEFISTEDNELFQNVLSRYEQGSIGYSEFVQGTLKYAADALKGKSVSDAVDLATNFYKAEGFEWFGYVKPTLKSMGDIKTTTVLVTAEPHFIASGIAKVLNFDHVYSSKFGITLRGTFDGTVESALDSKSKKDITERLVQGFSLSVAFGDSEGDVGMLQAVDTAICVKPNDGLRGVAEASGWMILDKPETEQSII